MKRIVLFLMLAVTIAACEPKSDIVILYDNDVHCYIDGYANMARMKEQMKQYYKYVAVVSSGDFSQGQAVGAASKGLTITDIMNSTGYDVVTLGNHEFDYGFEQLYKNLDNLKADAVCCNLVDLRDGKTLMKPYVIKKFGPTKVAFLGISTPNSINSSTPTFFQDQKGNFIYGFCIDSLMNVIQKNVNEARRKGADYVIALSHIGVAEDIEGLTSYIMAAQTSGIDVILDGHSHTRIECDRVKNKEGKDVIISQTESYFHNIGRLIIGADGSISTELIPTSEYTAVDETVAAQIDSIKNQFAEFAGRLVATTDFALMAQDDKDNRPTRYMEMPIGDLLADAYRYESQADIAFQNGGSIRANIESDEILYSHLLAVLPFGNSVVKIKVPGSVILDALEMSVAITPESFGGFLQVSGLTFEADLRIKSPVKFSADNMFDGIIDAPRRVRNVKVFDPVNDRYENLDPQQSYTVAANDYLLLNCGNGYTMFKEHSAGAKIYGLGVDATANYLSKTLGGKIPQQYSKSGNRIKLIK